MFTTVLLENFWQCLVKYPTGWNGDYEPITQEPIRAEQEKSRFVYAYLYVVYIFQF